LSSEPSTVFINSHGFSARTVNSKDAKTVSEIICEAIRCGMPPKEIGVVTPFRNHARRIRSELSAALGGTTAREVVADTVERMQGQER
ncbi:helicase, partial [Vibrio sp. 404]|nr:helicase [Vibrio marinisediminis]